MSNKVLKLTKALAIDGWMSQVELEWLALMAQSHKHIVELGSYCGRSTRVLAENTPGVVTAIDTWGANPLHQWDPEVKGKDLYSVFLKNMIDVEDKLRTIRADHSNMRAIPEEWLTTNQPDMIFIDGEHNYSGFTRDLINYSKRIAPGGLLCGHDANNPTMPGVDRVLDDFLPHNNRVSGTFLWWVMAPVNLRTERNYHQTAGEEGITFRRIS